MPQGFGVDAGDPGHQVERGQTLAPAVGGAGLAGDQVEQLAGLGGGLHRNRKRLNAFELFAHAGIGLADRHRPVPDPVPDLLQLGQIPVVGSEAELPTVLGFDRHAVDPVGVALDEVGFGRQRVAGRPAVETEHIAEPQRVAADDCRRHRPHGGLAHLSHPVEGLAGLVLAVVGDQLVALVEHPQHPPTGDQRLDQSLVVPQLFVVHDEHLVRLQIAPGSLVLGAVVDHRVQTGGVDEGPAQVFLELAQRAGDHQVDVARVVEGLGGGTGGVGLSGPGGPVPEVEPVGGGGALPGALQGAVEAEILERSQRVALDGQRLRPAGDVVPDVGGGRGPEHVVAVALQLLGEPVGQVYLVEDQVAAHPVGVAAVQHPARCLVERLELEVARILRVLFDQDDPGGWDRGVEQVGDPLLHVVQGG